MITIKTAVFESHGTVIRCRFEPSTQRIRRNVFIAVQMHGSYITIFSTLVFVEAERNF